MEQIPLPPGFVLPSQEHAREIDGRLLFSRRTIWIVYGSASIVGGALFLSHLVRRTALIQPIDADFHAVMIGVGVFAGILLAAVARDAWKIGIGSTMRRPAPTGLAALLPLAMLVALCGLGGSYVAGLLVEWQAFHGLNPPAVDTTFTLVGHDSTRSGDWIELQGAGADRFSVPCSDEMYRAVAIGEQLILPIQTGRGGVQRAVLPALRDLRRAG